MSSLSIVSLEVLGLSAFYVLFYTGMSFVYFMKLAFWEPKTFLGLLGFTLAMLTICIYTTYFIGENVIRDIWLNAGCFSLGLLGLLVIFTKMINRGNDR